MLQLRKSGEGPVSLLMRIAALLEGSEGGVDCGVVVKGAWGIEGEGGLRSSRGEDKE